MTILVIAEHDNQSLKAATLNTVAAAQKIGGDIHILVAGPNCQSAAQQAAQLNGVSTVKVADAAHYQNQTAENLTALVIANAGLQPHPASPHHLRQEPCPAHRRPSRRRPDLRNHRCRICGYLRASDLRR